MLDSHWTHLDEDRERQQEIDDEAAAEPIAPKGAQGGLLYRSPGKPYLPDQRDASPEPVAYLDPQTILDARRILPKAILGTMPPWPYGLTPISESQTLK